MIANLLRKSVQVVPWRYRQRIKDWPVVGPAQRWLVDRFLGEKPFLHTINAGPAKGLRMLIKLPEDKALWTGAYEPIFSAALANAITNGDVCYDVGGYRGFFAGVCALRGASAVHTFEPLPDNIRRIESLLEANASLPLTLHRVAVGAEVGEAEFLVMPETSMGKLAGSSFQQEAKSSESVGVTMETLDHLLESRPIPPPNLIKIDVEGAEAMVLRGAQRLLAQNRPRLFIEIHSHALGRECAELLTRCGYGVTTLETGTAPDFRTEPEVCHFVGAWAGGMETGG
jgi:FkbM family methyltransferase